MEGKIIFDKEDFNQFLARQRKEIQEHLRNKNYDEVMSVFAEVFYTARTEDRTLFYDFVGNFLREYPELQKNSRFKDAYNSRLKVLLSKDQRYEMDNYLLQNFFSVKPTVGSSKIHFCPNCGTEVEPNWKNCSNCGYKFERETIDTLSEGFLTAPLAAPPEILKTLHPESSESSKSSGFGIAAIIIGLIGCCCFWCAGVLAIILAMIGLAEDDEKALATIGLIIGICGVCGGVFQLFLIFGLLMN